MAEPLRIGGLPPVVLRAPPPPGAPGFVEAVVLPGRGFMLLQARIAMPDGRILDALEAPGVAQAARALDGGPDDFAGNGSFSFGGAILAPFANRIRGAAVAGEREIETVVAGRTVRLPRNWGGRAPGAETYAMHGLILAAPVEAKSAGEDRVRGRLVAGDFGGRWPGRAELGFEWRLRDGRLELRVEAVSLGPEPLAFGAGWHPYFRLPSGERAQAELRAPAALRAEVNDYDEVLPTGRLVEVAGTPFDFRGAGRPLGGLYLDDCFTGLEASDGVLAVELRDPAGGLGLRIAAAAPPVAAVQVYAPPDKPFVVIEPQLNLADPYGAAWAGRDTGMLSLEPGERAVYRASVSPFGP